MRVLVPFALSLALVAVGCSTVLDVDFGAAHLAAQDDAAAPGADAGADAPRTIDGCTPKTCAQQGFTCGLANDGCGNAIDCGSACANGDKCVANKCACQPKTCAALSATCGTQNDGCGGALDCGKCSAPQACVNGACKCVGKTCMDLGASCGMVPDGCGNTLSCGTCTGADVCGGGGANKCGPTPCTPKTCSQVGANCGTISDGCGGTVDCGTCSSPQTCGGGGTQNVCGCTPTTCAAQGKNCGSIPNGCGGTLDCGGCASPDTCGGGGTANVCGCTPTGSCSGLNCGAVGDGCGNTLNCGTCSGYNTCGGGGTPNVCGCTSDGSCSNCCGTGRDNCGKSCYDDTCCGGCFVAGTRIAMADGRTKAIEDVQVGDLVASWNPFDARVEAAHVRATPHHDPSYSTAGIVVVNGVVHATTNHPFSIENHATRADALAPGDRLVVLDARGVHTEHVRTVQIVPGGVPTFDLKVDGPGSFFADGVLVFIKP